MDYLEIKRDLDFAERLMEIAKEMGREDTVRALQIEVDRLEALLSEMCPDTELTFLFIREYDAFNN